LNFRGEDLSKVDRYSNSDEIIPIALRRYPNDPKELEGDQYFKDDVAVMLANNEEGLISQMFGVLIQVGEPKFFSLARRALEEAYPEDAARRKNLNERLSLIIADYRQLKRGADWKKLAADWTAAASGTATS
jgi:hypothetical protein